MKAILKNSAAGLALSLSVTAAAAEGELVLYNWFEYIPQELLDKFAFEHDVKVTMDTFDSNESLLAALKAGAVGDYDLAVPGNYMVKIMIEEGLLDSFDPSELSNHANIEDRWKNVDYDPGRTHSIPYLWGSTSFSVNRDVYQGDIGSSEILFNPPEELSGKINILDSQGEVLAFAALYLGIPQCSSDPEHLRKLDETLQNAKEHWASINADTSKEVLVSGDAAAGMIWGGFSAKARAEGANVEYSFPKEGYVVWMDNIVLLKDAPNRENALKFLDFMLEPENAAALSNWNLYGNGVAGDEDLLVEELASMPEANPPSEIHFEFVQACSEEVQGVYDKIWTRLKK